MKMYMRPCTHKGARSTVFSMAPQFYAKKALWCATVEYSGGIQQDNAGIYFCLYDDSLRY